MLIACQNPVSPGPPGPGPGPSGSHASGYTVTFKTNDGTDTVFATKTVTSPATTIGATDFPANPDRVDYIFGGWNTDSGGTGTGFNTSTPVTGNITVYAQWMAEPSPGSYAVIFALNDGTPNIHAIKIVDSPATTIDALPDPPNRTGYDFGGWNTDNGGTGTAFNASTTVDASITVYAKWNTYSYTVTFDKNGGETEASPATKTVDSPATTIDALPVPPAWSGYNFTGWNTGTGTAFTASTTVSANITVYAQWMGVGGPPAPGEGSLAYNITVPATMSRGFLGLYPVDAPGFLEEIPEILFTSSVSSILTNIPEGKYKAVIDLYDGDNNKAAYWTDVVQIHRDAITPLDQTFNPSNFTLCDPLRGEDKNTLAAKLDAALASSGSYTIVLNGTEEDLNSFAPKTLVVTGSKAISVTIRGNGNTVQLGSAGNLFSMATDFSSSLKLVLHDITLKGVTNNTGALVVVGERGTLEMKTGSHITGNISSSNIGGGGVYIYGGTFTMSGGAVSGNTASGNFSNGGGGGGVHVFVAGNFTMSGGAVSGNISSGDGGGVHVDISGNFTMSGGAVSGNISSGDGGGVHVDISGNFTMSGGAVSGNISSDDGGGVHAVAAFTMSGGAVSGNTASYNGGGIYAAATFNMSGGVVSGNTAGSSSYPSGGGVYYWSSSTSGFTKTGGIIYGYDAGDPDNANWNICKTSSGTISPPTCGYAAYYSKSPGYYRDLTLNTGDNISSTNLPTYPGAENSGSTNWIKK